MDLLVLTSLVTVENLRATCKFGCVDGDREIPDPIPNSEVKPVSGDGTALLSVGE